MMKGDTISRSALIEAFHTDIVNHMQYIDDSTVSVCIAEIEEAPTVDAAPVVHGRWIKGICNIYVCDQCGNAITSDIAPPAYCRDCGARMDGGEEE